MMATLQIRTHCHSAGSFITPPAAATAAPTAIASLDGSPAGSEGAAGNRSRIGVRTPGAPVAGPTARDVSTFQRFRCLCDGVISMAHQKNQACIEACIRCAQECEHCHNACLGEKDVAMMAECIRLDKDCAEICWSAAGYMSRGSQFMQDVCRVCAEICEACGAECRKHKADHCQRCADACDRCAEECRRMAGATA